MENPIKMDDLGGPPLFLEIPIWNLWEPRHVLCLPILLRRKPTPFPRRKHLLREISKRHPAGCSNVPKKHVDEQKKPSQFLLYWLVNRDPCNGLL